MVGSRLYIPTIRCLNTQLMTDVYKGSSFYSLSQAGSTKYTKSLYNTLIRRSTYSLMTYFSILFSDSSERRKATPDPSLGSLASPLEKCHSGLIIPFARMTHVREEPLDSIV